jgi:hypothetical protein
MTKDLLIILFAAPVAAVVLSFAIRSSRLSEYVTVIAAVIDLAVSIPVLLHVLNGPIVLAHSYVQVDLLGAWVILCISIVYTLSSIYAVGYMRLLDEESRLPLFYGLFSGFAFTMLAACIINNVGVFWIAIEQPRPTRHSALLLGRLVCPGAKLCNDLGGAPSIRAFRLSAPPAGVIPACSCRLRNQSRIGAYAYLAARCA